MDNAVDVAIVGAGAAGVAAARRLAGTGLSTLLIEASPRVGGRAWTVELAGMALDLGCEWFHTADRNPWTTIAEASGFEVNRENPPWGRSVPRPGFSCEDQHEANNAYEAWHVKMLGEPLPSDIAADHLVAGGPWNGYIQALSGFINGDVLENLSIADYANYERASTEQNWRPVRGYGTLVAASLPSGIACEVATPVERLGLPREGGVALSTPRGTVRARTVILTVSTAVLAGASMRLPSALDPWCEAALRLPLGHDEKLFLQIMDDDALPSETHAIGKPRDAATVAYHVRPLGRPLIECFLGGASAVLMEQGGHVAAWEFVANELTALFGSRFRRGVRLLTGSQWRSDLRIGGAYSHALPTHASARLRLALPFDDRVFFAGEATHRDAFSTAHGAYQSGVRAAEEVINVLSRRTRPGIP